MNNSFKNIFFDFDGTLVDTGPGIQNAARYALLKFGIAENNVDNLCRFVGPPLAEVFAEYYGFSPEDAVRAVHAFREYYLEKGWTECSIYPGIPEMLSSVKNSGKRLVVATGKPEDLAVKISKRFGIFDYFDIIRGAYVDDEGEHRNDKKEIITTIFEELNIIDPSTCIMTGDRANDIRGAHRAGIKAIGTLWGYGSEKELSGAGAEYSVRTPQELSEMIINDLF